MANLIWVLGAVGGILGIIFWATQPAMWLGGLALIALGASGIFAGIAKAAR